MGMRVLSTDEGFTMGIRILPWGEGCGHEDELRTRGGGVRVGESQHSYITGALCALGVIGSGEVVRPSVERNETEVKS